MQFNQSIAFASKWKSQFKIALILGIVIAFIMVFLQPFDTFQNQIEAKSLKLSGYALTVIFPMLLIHPVCLSFYQKRNEVWTLLHEVVYLILLVFMISVFSYFYHAFVFTNASPSIDQFSDFFLFFCLPFIPILLPIIAYLRFTMGDVLIHEKRQDQEAALGIKNSNGELALELTMNEFVYAEAQQNYVNIYYCRAGKLHKEMIRSTLSNLVDQMPDAQQLHRSYLVNMDFVEEAIGNARQRSIKLKGVEEMLPVSKKSHEAVIKHLQIQP